MGREGKRKKEGRLLWGFLRKAESCCGSGGKSSRALREVCRECMRDSLQYDSHYAVRARAQSTLNTT